MFIRGLSVLCLLGIVFISCVPSTYDLNNSNINPYTKWYLPADKDNYYYAPLTRYPEIAQAPSSNDIMKDAYLISSNGYKFIGKSVVNSSKISPDDEYLLIRAHAGLIGADYAVYYRRYAGTDRGYYTRTRRVPGKIIDIETDGHVFKNDFTFFKANTRVRLPSTYETYKIPYSQSHYDTTVMYWRKIPETDQ